MVANLWIRAKGAHFVAFKWKLCRVSKLGVCHHEHAPKRCTPLYWPAHLLFRRLRSSVLHQSLKLEQ